MKPSPTSPLAQLLAAPMRAGTVLWIGLRPARGAPIIAMETAQLIAKQGIDGDRYKTQRDGARQVTLVSHEALAAIAAYLGRDRIAPELVRRNVVTAGINLAALKGRFRLGPALLEYSGECAPCSQMEIVLGTGGYNAMRGHGGITARIIEGGEVRLGEAIVRAD